MPAPMPATEPLPVAFFRSVLREFPLHQCQNSLLWAVFGDRMSFLDHLAACNRKTLSDFVPLSVDQARIGWVRHDHAAVLRDYPAVFACTETTIQLLPTTEEQRSAALAEVVADLAARGAIERLRGELFSCKPQWSGPELFRLDRAAVSFLGIRAYGVHLNGYCRTPDGKMMLWVARRAKDKRVAPGKLDNIVAGGQPAGLGVLENLLKEAAEEADIPADLARSARSVGAVSYCFAGSNGLKPDTMFCYDLCLPLDFVPRNTDGEVESFELWPVEDVLHSLRTTDDFKFNVPLVILDFAIRQGLLTADNEPDFEAIVSGLRAPLPV